MSKPDCTLIVGPSGCGKTYTLLHHIIEGEYGGVFDFIIILCPTIWINDSYVGWKYLSSDEDVIGLEIAADKLDSVLEFIIKMYGGARTAVIVDDLSNTNEQHRNNNQLTYLAYSGRHHKISLFIITQKLNSISTGIRENATRVVFFKTHNRNSVRVLREEFFAHIHDGAAEKKMLEQLDAHKYLDVKLGADPPSYTVN